MITPEEFEKRIKEILADPEGYTRTYHEDMDELMCKVLEEHGYGDGVKIFREADKWYA